MKYFQKYILHISLLAIVILPNKVNGQIQDDIGLLDTAISDTGIFYASIFYSDEDGNGSSDCMVGLAQGNPVAYASYSCIIRFRSDVGFVDAHNGATYTYNAANAVPVGTAFGVKYEVWFEVDISAGKWTPWVKGPGMTDPVKVLDNVDFRAKDITQVDTWKAVHQNPGDDGLDILTIGLVDSIGKVPASYYEASIDTISLLPEGLNEVWHPDSTYYTAVFPFGTSSVDVSATPLQRGTSISGDGTVDVTAGSGQFSIGATSESGTTTTTYTVDWTHTDSLKDATLSSLKILDGLSSQEYQGLSPEFSPTADNYLINLPIGTEEVVVQATASAGSQGATVAGDGTVNVSSGAELITITVTSADGSTSQKYELEIFVGQKSIYIPASFSDPSNPSSQWSYERSIESDNFILFWEEGYGTDPGDDPDSDLRANVNDVLSIAEKSYKMYRDSLKLVNQGASKTDEYKMIILLFYTKDWIATGSGVDDEIGLLNLSAWGARSGNITISHEVGHCFQYQAGADQYPLDAGDPIVGWRYGLGTNGAGGNGWWEQCAQWQAFKVFPDAQFNNVGAYLASNHLNILHEKPRYENYFIQDYWTYKHDWGFIGRLWRESYFPEDPVDAYKRIASINQEQFNDEMYEHAARLATWDIPHIKEYGKNYILSRDINPLNPEDDGSWTIEPGKCIENYGYNVVRLNVPDSSSRISVYFEGKAGADGYRSINKVEAGWRYGFVALLENGERIYSSMASSKYDKINNANPLDTLHFFVPDKCDKLWFVVSGAPQRHWHHEWDDDTADDEQWPYQVKFESTNPYGVFEFEQGEQVYSDTLSQIVTLLPVTANTYPVTPTQPELEQVCQALKMDISEIKTLMGSKIKYCAVNPNGTFNYQSTAQAPGHWFADNGYVTTYSNSNSHIFSEFKIDNFVFNIGQYPNRCQAGDQITIRQALVYTPEGQDPVHVIFVFNVKIVSPNNLDGDSFTDEEDNCPGIYNEDQSDIDGDGIGDICDKCPVTAGNADADGDGVIDGCDSCEGFNDLLDADADGVPDGCDQCAGFVDGVDSDGDGVVGGCDICEGYNDSLDADNDGVPDGCELCAGFNDSIDTDADGVPDGCDVCQGYNDTVDLDTNGIPDGCDIIGVQPVLLNVSIGPNPVDKILHVNWSDAKISKPSIKIYDINGRLQWEANSLPGDQTYIDLEGLEKGMYFLYLRTKENAGRYKFLKR